VLPKESATRADVVHARPAGSSAQAGRTAAQGLAGRGSLAVPGAAGWPGQVGAMLVSAGVATVVVVSVPSLTVAPLTPRPVLASAARPTMSPPVTSDQVPLSW
jgi:hypothetical protein